MLQSIFATLGFLGNVVLVGFAVYFLINATGKTGTFLRDNGYLSPWGIARAVFAMRHFFARNAQHVLVLIAMSALLFVAVIPGGDVALQHLFGNAWTPDQLRLLVAAVVAIAGVPSIILLYQNASMEGNYVFLSTREIAQRSAPASAVGAESDRA